jgi:hypothetical protein
LFLVVVAHDFDIIFVAPVGDQFVTADDGLDVNRLAVIFAFAESQECEIVLDIMVLVPIGVDIGCGDGVYSVRGLAIMITGSKVKVFASAANAMTSSQDHIAMRTVNDAGSAVMVLDVAAEQDAD